MSDITHISVEILRHGPPHGHLLSPLTQYLARSGNHAQTISFPFEHRELLHMLRYLRYPGEEIYEGEERERFAALEELGVTIADVLRSIPDFFRLNSKSGQRLVHLEMELSSSELAMIPFELSDMPTGEGSERGRMTLQTQMPVTLTRRVRGVSGARVGWPVAPRVLFAWSDKGGEVPHEEHWICLEEALSTWRDSWNRPLLVPLPNATLERIEEENTHYRFTHVHLLAHGNANQTLGEQFELILDRDGEDDLEESVSGWRLASALCPRTTRPAVVSLAACYGADVGSIHDRTGASIAHSLHQEGVSLVVASQFPLTAEGSLVMTRELYRGLFAGNDPRHVLHDVRTALHRRSGQDHDWASMVAYAAFPPDLESKLEETRFELARRTDNRAYDRENLGPDPWPTIEREMKAAIDLYPHTGRYAAEGKGMRGSAFKRLARAAFDTWQDCRQTDRLDDCIRFLGRSSDCYADAARLFMTPRKEDGPQSITSLHWVLTQHLSLRAVLGHELPSDWWWASWANARAHAERGVGEDRTWAYASFAELCLLQLAVPKEKRVSEGRFAGRRGWASRTVHYAKKTLEQEGDPAHWRVKVVRNAFRRYTRDWWMNRALVAHLEKRGLKRQCDWKASRLTQAAQRVVKVLDPR